MIVKWQWPIHRAIKAACACGGGSLLSPLQAFFDALGSFGLGAERIPFPLMDDLYSEFSSGRPVVVRVVTKQIQKPRLGLVTSLGPDHITLDDGGWFPQVFSPKQFMSCWDAGSLLPEEEGEPKVIDMDGDEDPKNKERVMFRIVTISSNVPKTLLKKVVEQMKKKKNKNKD